METAQNIERFVAPDAAFLMKGLNIDEETAVKVAEVLVRHYEALSRAFNHEDALKEIDVILGTCGIETIAPEGAEEYTDEGIDLCPPFSYCNTGDSYAPTLARDHKARQWVIASWADLLQEYEMENEIGDFKMWEECPDRCVSCHAPKQVLKLTAYPNSARGFSYSWICVKCNHHHLAEMGYEPEADCSGCGYTFALDEMEAGEDGSDDYVCPSCAEEAENAEDEEEESAPAINKEQAIDIIKRWSNSLACTAPEAYDWKLSVHADELLALIGGNK